MILQTNTEQMRLYSGREDSSRQTIFVILVVAAIASLGTVIFLLSTSAEKLTPSAPSGDIALAMTAVVCSWLFIHTTFTIHHAHLYYCGENDQDTRVYGGLDFPKEDQPDYLDFAYFSFVIGMTAQVSDVAVSSQQMRRLVLPHSWGS